MKFEVFRANDGKYSWRLREANGRIVKVTPGKIMLPPSTAAEKRRSQAAVQHALAAHFKTQSPGA